MKRHPIKDDDDKFYIVLFRQSRHDGKGDYEYSSWRIFRGYTKLGPARSIVTRRHNSNKLVQGKIVVCRPLECEDVTDDLQTQFNAAEATMESAAMRAGDLERRLKANEIKLRLDEFNQRKSGEPSKTARRKRST